jgi:hypothetical protein
MVKKNLKTEGQECNTLKKLNTVYHGRRVNYRKKREKKTAGKKLSQNFFNQILLNFVQNYSHITLSNWILIPLKIIISPQ